MFGNAKSTSIETWTDERVERLKSLWANGLSCSQIAGEIGGVSRNAVIGKVCRLKLDGRKPRQAVQRIAKSGKAERKHPFKIKSVAPRARTDSGSLEPLVIPTPIEDTEIPVEQRRTLVQLTDETCRWPVGTPGEASFFFCGGKTTDRHVKIEGEWREVPHHYCSHHYARSVDRPGTSASLMRAEVGQQNFTTFGNQRRAFG